jgi:NADH-quinone oxidoreductase subunit L
VVHEAVAGAAETSGGSLEYVLMAVSVAIAVVGIMIAFSVYKSYQGGKDPVEAKAPGLYKLLENKWYIDEIYDALVVRPVHFLSVELWKKFDVGVIDRIVLGFGRVTAWTGQTVRVIQTGSIQVYAVMLLIGLIATVGYLIYGLV